MPAQIQFKTALSSSFLVQSVLFVLLSVNSTYSVASGTDLFPAFTFGTLLVAASVAILLTEFTAQQNKKQVTSAIIILISTLWMGVGLNDIWYDVLEVTRDNYTDVDISESEALVPGYASFCIIFILLLIINVASKSNRSLSVLLLVLSTLLVFRILETYTNIQGSHVLFILLCLISVFMFVSFANFHSVSSNIISPVDKTKVRPPQSKVAQSYLEHVVYFGLNVVAYSVFASLSTTVLVDVSCSIAWLLSVGIVLLTSGISFLRRDSYFFQNNLIISGSFWVSVSANFVLTELFNETFTLKVPVTVAISLASTILCLNNFKRSPLISLTYVCIILITIALAAGGSKGVFLEVIGWIGFIASVYGFAAYVCQCYQLTYRIPTFEFLSKLACFKRTNELCCKICLKRENNSSTHNKMFGYSKYLEAEDLGFAASAIAALSSAWPESGSDVHSVSWVVGFGGIVLFLVGFISFSRGKTFESCVFITCALFWSIWGPLRPFYSPTGTFSTNIGCVSFLFISLVLTSLSLTVNKASVFQTSLFALIVLNFLLHNLDISGTRIFELVVIIAYTLVCFYICLSKYLSISFETDVLTLGKPILQISYLHTEGSKALWAECRRATGVNAIANLLKEGKICGIPSDTVYVLVAACNKPEAVKRAYHTKKQADDRPMSIWISDTKQIESAKEQLGSILWDFMHEVWPSNISLVVPRGEWTDLFGLGDAAQHVGRKDSIAVRMPNNSIVCYLISQTGPIAVTSANPTGEADTTHHLQVIAKLGLKNCDGILCDGPSPENAASTVVDCRNINERKIGFFRIGLTPKSKVQEIFQRVLERHQVSKFQSSDFSDPSIQVDARKTIGGKSPLTQNGKVNPAFDED
ncbi:hypothetical protein FSP39_021573 [Pinctada imbricata]|uniref:Threonylcarbamoyl-AMP synthase n=1 Tax=Pinctada imbricata TaxID=66713 RepID=A0AA88Y8Y5_PINIB|nr:hypothetical protein FSP39_021573 [Pinctada imbricata]